MEITPIAHIRSALPTKFGVPRQSGLAPGLVSQVELEKPYRTLDALRGLEDFSHLWLIWEFSQVPNAPFSPTVRPPRLGGNRRMGVFATRSPFRPNRLGLSCVKLEKIEQGAQGPVLWVSGADLMDGTPIYDIKPYLPYADCRPEAVGGFTEETQRKVLQVICPEELWAAVPEALRPGLKQVLAQDPRPAYQHDPKRIYGMPFAHLDVRFQVTGDTLTVTEIRPTKP